jgi:SAM-dependent methyltransferase
LNLGLYEEIELSPEWREFHREFVAIADEDSARIHFDLGALAIPVEVALVSLHSHMDESAQNGRSLDLGAFRRLTPVSREWGFDRGTPIDRYYIEKFLAGHTSDIRGCVLEIGDDIYTRNFGQDVSVSEVLHVTTGNPRATLVADLTDASQMGKDIFDCAIVSETLQYIYDVPAAIATLHRILKPGGVVLATFPGIIQSVHENWESLWRFTAASAKRLFGAAFAGGVEVRTYGNVLTAVSFLHGLAKEDLRQEELDYHDPDYEVKIAVRAVKPVRTS